MAIRLVDLGPLLTDAARDAAAQMAELNTELAPSGHPVALLPVRLETRFFARSDGTSELRVRIFPDQIHIDAHDPRLSAEEVAWGERYWRLQWRAGSDDARLRSAWRMLTDRFEPGRAAWIARRLEPTNQVDRPADSAGEDDPIATEPQLPDLGDPALVVRTPRAGVLPLRWTATAYRDGRVLAVATGRDVVSDLAVGPDPDEALAPAGDDPTALAIDDGMRWMVDFGRAEEIGMAIRLPLPEPVDTAAVDVLLVAGVTGAGAAAGAEQLAALLDAHHYSDGLALLTPGTPTNNSEQQRAGYVSRDRRGELSFAVEWPATPPGLGPATDGGRLGAALGLGPDRMASTIGHLAGASAGDETLSEALQTALWPATWGYYLSQFVGQAARGDRDWVRDHARHHLRPAGSLPTLRCGRQPYGFLPVTALGGWTGTDPDAGRADRLRLLLIGLRDHVWRPATQTAARIGRTDNPDADLVDVLRTDAASAGYKVRRALGPHYLRHLRLFLGENLDAAGFFAQMQQLTLALPARIGLGPASAMSLVVHEGEANPVTVPLVRTATMTDGPALDYVSELLAADPDTLAAPVPQQAVPLLNAILRHGFLREHAEAAARLLDGQDRTAAGRLTDAEFVDLVADPNPTETWSRQRGQPLPGASPERTVGDHLRQLTDFSAPEVRSLGEFRAALGVLAASDPTTIERLLPPVLDATSYRLDAWVSSYAASRLAELRAAQPAGLLTGGYGWLENLRFEPGIAIADLPPDEPGPLVAATDDPGFIVAPSLTQAGAAAMLRNAHLAHGGGEDSPYAIRLTSDRVRLAERLFDGVRQGQPLGALLGYDVERRLHEVGLDEFIDDLRRFAPRPGENGDEAVSRRIQLDGLVLQDKWRTEPEHLLDHMTGLTESDPRRPVLTRVLSGLDAAVDAAADAVTAESVYQMARGNLSRGAGTLNEIANGQAPPPQLEFMRTPRTGTAITHRVAVVMDAADRVTPASGWADGSRSPRAAAEPRLNAWAGRLLGPATGVEVGVAELGSGGELVADHHVPLTALQLSPLDLVWISGDAGAAGELARRAYTAAVPDAATATAQFLRLDLSPAADRGERCLADLLEVASALRRLIAGARPLDGADLQPAHADPDRRFDLDELEARVHGAQQALAGVRQTLGDLLDDPTATVGRYRKTLAETAAFGVSAGLNPLVGGDGEPAPAGSATASVAAAIFADVVRRLTDADRESAGPAGEPDVGRRDRLLRRLQAVFGPGFVAVPVFTTAAAPDIDAAQRSTVLLAGDPLAAYTWATRMERVRPALARLTMAYRLSELLGTGSELDLTVAQVPHKADLPWIGLTLTEGTAPDGLASVVLQGAREVAIDGPLAGLLVDEWTEVVPSRNETAGLAFRYDPPDAMAPQSVLLAVPPVLDQPWTIGTLNQVLLETLDLTHLRAVGPESLGAAGQYLPATMLAFNPDGDAVSTDPNSLIGRLPT